MWVPYDPTYPIPHTKLMITNNVDGKHGETT
jgi:hypothetical protein